MNAISITKRGIDIVFGTAILLCASPFMFIIAIVIKLTSKGPMFYMQKRIGVMSSNNGTFSQFNLYKFRTMIPNAEKATGAILCQKNDPRTTAIGRFLRRTRLDELPQFINVLMGDMSIVGPRPERPELVAPLSTKIPFFEERTRYVKPGITGLAQVSLTYGGHLPKESALSPLESTLVRSSKNGRESISDGMRIKFLSLSGIYRFAALRWVREWCDLTESVIRKRRKGE